MKITRLSRHSKRITFTKPSEGVRFIAGMNESHGNYESAAKLYREIGDVVDAERCEKLIKPTNLSPGWKPTYNNPDNHNCEPPAEPV